ncbi:hypothetical protein [Neobacillus cucumis]|uniref:HesB/YadR/YfhF family protein n=1 Tax=Neobacillus cucumis TaxID=1740721 RepID=UPI002E239C72|nr:hypothetical protein [Neobacillus cucumis]
MFISIDEKAASWFTKEFENSYPIGIRLYPQYAGFGEKNKGFSLAFSAEQPANIGYAQKMNGITFYVDENDTWFFEETETYLSFNEDMKEIQISFRETCVH